MEIKKLKPKNKKAKSSLGRKNSTCAYCGSKLVTNDLGVLECSGTNLGLWDEVFSKYENMSSDQKTAHLTLYADSSLFTDLYDQWSKVDENGLKIPLKCLYTNSVFNPLSRSKTQVPDPVVVTIIERSLNRELTEEERNNESPIWREGKVYFSDYKEGRKKVRIPILIYPDSFL